MGLNAIKCEGYADVKESGSVKGLKSASDFNAGDLVGITVLGGMAVASGILAMDMWLQQYTPHPMYLDKGSEYYEEVEVHDSFIADKVGDKSSLEGHGGMKYTTVFQGIERDENGILKVHADVIGKNPSGLEEVKHVVVEDYKTPQTYDEALKQYNNLTTNGSIPSVAILDFEDVKVGSFTRSVGDFIHHGNFEKVLSDAKVAVYAKIESNTKASITTTEGHIVPPEEWYYLYNGGAVSDGSEVILYSKTVRSVMPPMPGVPTMFP